MTLRPLRFVDGAAAGECPQESAMVKIVVYLRRIEQRELGIDRKAQVRMRGPPRLLDRRRPLGAREDESKIAGTLGKRQQALIDLRGYLHVEDLPTAAPGIHTIDTADQTAPWDRVHHTCGGSA